ncbi:hypothetical protein ACF5W4_02420 [Bacillota bacterium Lsc_1132]
MSGKKEQKVTVRNVSFAGTEKLEDVLLELVTREIDNLVASTYDIDMVSATPKGVANK